MRHLGAETQPLKVGAGEPGRAALLGPAVVSWPSSHLFLFSFCRLFPCFSGAYWLCFLGGGT